MVYSCFTNMKPIDCLSMLLALPSPIFAPQPAAAVVLGFVPRNSAVSNMCLGNNGDFIHPRMVIEPHKTADFNTRMVIWHRNCDLNDLTTKRANIPYNTGDSNGDLTQTDDDFLQANIDLTWFNQFNPHKWWSNPCKWWLNNNKLDSSNSNGDSSHNNVDLSNDL